MRKPWHEYFMDIAFTVASRSTCPKRQVGAVIVNDRKILSTGYNGSPSGMPHCDNVDCLLNVDGNCIRTIHAEANAIARLNEQGNIIYCTDQPCVNCLKLIISAGIDTIYFRRPYESADLTLFMDALSGQQRVVNIVHQVEDGMYKRIF